MLGLTRVQGSLEMICSQEAGFRLDGPVSLCSSAVGYCCRPQAQGFQETALNTEEAPSRPGGLEDGVW